MSGSTRVVLWRADASAAMLRPVGVSGGAAPRPQVIHGNAIQWLIRESISGRIDPAPVWAVTQRVLGVPLQEQIAQHALTIELADEIEVQPQQFDALGIYVGAIMNVMRDHEILSAHQARSEYLIEALRALPSVSTEDAIARELIIAARRIAGAGGAAISRWNGESGEVIESEAGVRVGAVFEGTQSLSSLAARSAATIVREGAALRALKVLAKDERFTFTPNSALVIPLVSHGAVVGLLTVWSMDPIAEAAVTALETLAPYAASQLEHARELGMMKTLAERDALTSLHNRRAF
ncbi:MAG TPA: GAF domain-containing protein, partial [Longimicrobiales bacterium]|nr:GAF domain-containing protein [Longimicrobiales bacterium]